MDVYLVIPLLSSIYITIALIVCYQVSREDFDNDHNEK